MFFEKQRFSSTDMYIYIEFRRLDRSRERIKSLSLSRISQCFFLFDGNDGNDKILT